MNLDQLQTDFERAYSEVVVFKSTTLDKANIRRQYHLQYLQAGIQELRNKKSWYWLVPDGIQIIASVEGECLGLGFDIVAMDEGDALRLAQTIANHTKVDWQLFQGNQLIRVVRCVKSILD